MRPVGGTGPVRARQPRNAFQRGFQPRGRVFRIVGLARHCLPAPASVTAA